VRVVIDVVGVMAAYFDLLCVCIMHRADGYGESACTVHNTHVQQFKICRHNTDNINDGTQIGTRNIILAKQWMWLSDDGFI
jgi:hypothetical protein